MSFDNPVDTTALIAALEQATAIQDTGYTASTWNTLQSAISSGQSLLAGTGYTQEQVDSAASLILSAIDALILLPTVPDLAARIAFARTIEDAGYTTSSWTTFITALSAAQALLDSREYTQSELAAMDARLESAINGLTIATTPDPGGSGGGGGRYLVDGIQTSDLLPAQTAIMDNLWFAIQNGLVLFGIFIGVSLIPKILRRFTGGTTGVDPIDRHHK